MSPTVQRRKFLTALGAGIAGLSGCVGNLPGSGDGVDRTIYVGAYHWGFVIVDESGEEQERVSLQRNDVLRVVSFNTLSSQAIQSLPSSIREALPDHEALEERNEERIPQSATRPVVRQLGATRRGDYTLSCLTYCGYGHPYMEIDGGIVVT